MRVVRSIRFRSNVMHQKVRRNLATLYRRVRFRVDPLQRELLRRRARTRRLHEPRRPEEVAVSVVIPVKDAGPELSDLIGRMKRQEGFRAVEMVIVDSGSTDGSAETAESLGADVVRIAPELFSHSYARNLAAERARGDYLLFTVQDALPSSDRWLLEMFSGLKRHQAAAVSCGEEPRGDADLFYRAISWQHHRFMSRWGRDAVLSRLPDDTPMEARRNGQITDVACLIGRELFLRYRYRGNYAEDLDLGLRLTGDGYRLAFLASTRIFHSHNRPAYYHLKRSYVESLALFDLLPGFPSGPVDDAASVADDIVYSCRALDECMRGALRTLAPPLAPRAVRDAAVLGLRSKPTASAGAAAGPGDYLDERTRALVVGLEERYRPDADADHPRHSLVQAAAVARMLGAYLAHSRQTIDRPLLEEFKSALYKGWAQTCGIRLAALYWRGPEAVRESMRDLHAQMARGV
jgi:glycosyltransferase involved in cell wall biosynthesis